MVAVCSACNPPPSSNSEAARAITRVHSVRCRAGVLSTPLALSMLSTIAPLSAEVTKKITIIRSEITLRALVAGKNSMKRNKPTAGFS